MQRRSDIEPLTTLFEPTQTVSDAQEFLGARIVKLTSNHLMVRQHDGGWLEVKDPPTAAQKGRALWAGAHTLPSGQRIVITEDDIIAFVMAGPKYSKAMVPLVSGRLMVPACDALAVTFEGHRYVNTWSDTLMKGDEGALNDPRTRQDLETLLRMVREGLCDRSSVEILPTMMQMLHSQDPAEEIFRYTMSWFAAGFQEPGVNLPTNLWQLGEMQGMGRGTFQTVMQRLYGGNLVLTANMSEWNRGWTDQMANRLLLCLNEVGEAKQKASDMDVMDFCKQYANESKVTIAKRYLGIGTGSVPQFCNFCGTGNRWMPMKGVHATDRRQQFHKTSQDPAKLRYSTQMHDILEGNDTGRAEAMLQAFAFVMRSLKVEHDLISHVTQTELRTMNVEACQTEEDYWLANDNNYQRDEWHPAGKWASWHHDFDADADKLSPRKMATVMNKLALGGHVEREPARPKGVRKQPTRWRVHSSKYPKDETAADSDPISRANKAMAGLRERRAKAEQVPVLYLSQDQQDPHSTPEFQ